MTRLTDEIRLIGLHLEAGVAGRVPQQQCRMPTYPLFVTRWRGKYRSLPRTSRKRVLEAICRVVPRVSSPSRSFQPHPLPSMFRLAYPLGIRECRSMVRMRLFYFFPHIVDTCLLHRRHVPQVDNRVGTAAAVVFLKNWKKVLGIPEPSIKIHRITLANIPPPTPRSSFEADFLHDP